MKTLNYVLIVAGIIGVLSAIVVSPALATRHVSSDQPVTPSRVDTLRQYMLLALGSGLALIVMGCTFLLLGWTPLQVVRDSGRMLLSKEYKWPLVLPLALTSVTLIVISTSRYGAGLSPDSVGYISVARSIRAGEGVVRYDDSPLVVQPPAYPALLAMVDWLLGIDPLFSSGAVNATILGLIVLLSGRLIATSQISPTLAYFGALLVAFSLPLYEVSVMAWTEPLFICFEVLCLLNLKRYLEDGRRLAFAAAAGSVALACLTRYIGITLIVAGVVTILLFDQNGWKHRISRAILFSGLSALPTIAWLARNYVLTGTLVGQRAPSSRGLLTNLALAVYGVMTFFVPGTFLLFFALLVLIAGALALWIGLGAQQATSSDRLKNLRRASRLKSVRRGLTHSQPSGVLLPTYTAFLVYSSTTTAFDPINHRLLSPTYVPLIVIMLSSGQVVCSQGRHRAIGRAVIVLLALALLIHPVVSITRSTARKRRFGAGGYNSVSWREAPATKYLTQWNPAQPVCYSNAPDALYILTDTRARRIPHRRGHNSSETANQLEDLRGRWPEKPSASLVWLDNTHREYLFNIDQLKEIATISPLKRLDEATIYLVERNEHQ